MYEEIIRHLMKWEILTMVFWTLLCLVLPISIYVYVLIKDKKRKKNKRRKKTWKHLFSESPEGKALSWVIIVIVFFCVFFGMELFKYLSLREDMIAENYVTYTGEFEHDTHHVRRSSTSYVEWTNEQGETKSIIHNFHIDDFQTCEQDLRDGRYKGTVVYSPRANILLWWDAEPVGE